MQLRQLTLTNSFHNFVIQNVRRIILSFMQHYYVKN